MIYISTGGFYQKNSFQVSEELINVGCTCIELSAGRYSDTLFSDLKAIAHTVRFQIHNYFPPPKVPIVLNLASRDREVASATIEHIKKAIQWSTELGQSTYSFHAGFLMDPKVEELGKKVQPRTLFNRNEALAIFIERVNLIDEYALTHGVKILIENNVLSANNFQNFKSNPFLMTDANECIEVMRQTSNNVQLLVDVAHLKVSASSLGFDPVDFLVTCNDWIGAYHLSDNDGKRDSNEPLSNESWFWPHLRRDLDYYTLEVYNVTPTELALQLDLAKKQLENKIYESS
jgi:sugar phosphate isomerase/epimerase